MGNTNVRHLLLLAYYVVTASPGAPIFKIRSGIYFLELSPDIATKRQYHWPTTYHFTNLQLLATSMCGATTYKLAPHFTAALSDRLHHSTEAWLHRSKAQLSDLTDPLHRTTHTPDEVWALEREGVMLGPAPARVSRRGARRPRPVETLPRGIEHEVRGVLEALGAPSCLLPPEALLVRLPDEGTASRCPPSMPDESLSSRELCYCDETLGIVNLVWEDICSRRQHEQTSENLHGHEHSCWANPDSIFLECDKCGRQYMRANKLQAKSSKCNGPAPSPSKRSCMGASPASQTSPFNVPQPSHLFWPTLFMQKASLEVEFPLPNKNGFVEAGGVFYGVIKTYIAVNTLNKATDIYGYLEACKRTSLLSWSRKWRTRGPLILFYFWNVHIARSSHMQMRPTNVPLRQRSFPYIM
ncbi:hypothetical protein PR048_011147 [Dryococelus australis]|uniref:C2H2-type domain-containing protein n=1 Tax=Dryococelus australis TaxID=614101 RepID=A0ABQ9HKU0_9NEOP|nr:hypothetical protein PR048_011147 [Dryococelus australis]